MNDHVFPKSELRDCPSGFGIVRERAKTINGSVTYYRPYEIRSTDNGEYKLLFNASRARYADGQFGAVYLGDTDRHVAFNSRREAVAFLIGIDWNRAV